MTDSAARRTRTVACMKEEPAGGVVDVYTDGACSGNPGPGGWGVVLSYRGREKELYGGEPGKTPNNRMELMAATRALETLTRPLPAPPPTHRPTPPTPAPQLLPKSQPP